MMKIFALVFVCLVATTYAGSVPQRSTERVVYSDNAKADLRAAAKTMIETLCLADQVDPDIMRTICMRAMYKALGKTVYSEEELVETNHFSSNCMDCDVADPICWEACPQ